MAVEHLYISCFPTHTELHLVVTVPGRVVGGVDHTSASFPHLQAVLLESLFSDMESW